MDVIHVYVLTLSGITRNTTVGCCPIVRISMSFPENILFTSAVSHILSIADIISETLPSVSEAFPWNFLNALTGG